MKYYKLKNLLSVFRNGATIKQTKNSSGVPISRIETISNGTIDFNKVGYADIYNDNYKEYYLQDGDILFSHINSIPHLGKCAIFQNTDKTLIHGMNLLLLRANKNILSKYLFYLLKSKPFRAKLPTITKKSVNQASLSITNLGDIDVCICSLDEQQRIVNILDKAEEIRTKKKLANEKLDEFLKSTFIDMFGDPVTNPKGYNIELIKNISTVITGNTPPRTNEEYYGNYIEWIKSDNINTPYTYLTKAEEYLSELGMQKGRVVPKNSILVTCIAGSFNCIGNVALTDRPVAFNQQINAIIPEKKYINSAFLYEQLYIGKKLIQEKSTNSMKGMVSKSKFETIKLILPDLKEQELFEKIFVEVEKQKEKNQKVIEQMDNLFSSLMQQAFNHN